MCWQALLLKLPGMGLLYRSLQCMQRGQQQPLMDMRVDRHAVCIHHYRLSWKGYGCHTLSIAWLSVGGLASCKADGVGHTQYVPGPAAVQARGQVHAVYTIQLYTQPCTEKFADPKTCFADTV
jgi:hypothetical protein